MRDVLKTTAGILLAVVVVAGVVGVLYLSALNQREDRYNTRCSYRLLHSDLPRARLQDAIDWESRAAAGQDPGPCPISNQ